MLKRCVLPILTLLLLTGCAPRRASAQFIGYSAPQTNQQTLGTNVTCTGSAQNFPVSNFGQISHQAQRTGGSFTTSFFMSLQGSVDGVFFSNFSDTSNGQSGGTGTAVSGQGYFPVVRVQVTCLPNTATFSISYSAIASSSNAQSGVNLQSSTTKTIFSLISAGTSISSSSLGPLTTPFGSSAGQLAVSISAGGFPAGSTIQVVCNGVGVGVTQPFIFPMNVSNGIFVFPVPQVPCPGYTVSYVSGGASASLLSIEYEFTPPGLPSAYDPCQSPGAVKSSVPINLTTATTTQLVALNAAQTVYVCGVTMTIAPSGTAADTITFEYGTGASCGTGTTVLTGALGAGDLTTTTGVTPISFADPGTSFKTPIGNALCALSAGTTVNIQGFLTYVQQ